jgi:hypothetical protein
MEITHRVGDSYIVTGKTVRGKRFRINSDNLWHAMGINLYRGSVWQVRDGKRKLIKRVNN